MKMEAKSCYVCGRRYEPGEEYLQVEVETSRKLDDEASKFRKCLIEIDCNEDAQLLKPYMFYLRQWMRTSWVCLKCVKALPVEWQQIFSRPSLDEWIPVQQLGNRTFAVKRRVVTKRYCSKGHRMVNDGGPCYICGAGDADQP